MAENLPKMTVSELTSLIKNTLEESFFGLTVEGEISTFKPSSTGHWYFSLKDQNALINAVIWKYTIPSIGFVPKDGQKVIVTGNINLYAPRGNYQISCTSMRLAGDGDILAKLEERKKYYASIGYFDEDKKKPIPKSPTKVAVITSPSGAALQDILKVTGRRNSTMDIIILPAVVQGSDAAQTIAGRINQVNLFVLADVIIVGRGGGSLEDLLPFSEDCVIEAIHNSEIPVISAVGHEIDWAISDFVADIRASTPSVAAELVCQNQDDQKQQLSALVNSMETNIKHLLDKTRLAFTNASPKTCKYILQNKITQFRISVDGKVQDMQESINSTLDKLRSSLDINTATIEASNPNSILDRGFVIVTNQNGKTVKSAEQLKTGNSLSLRFNKGKAKATVTEVING